MPMFRLSYNTNALLNLPLEKAIEEVAKAGYDGIEISLHHSHLHPYEVTKERLNELKELFARLSIKPVALATGGPYLLGEVPFQPSLISSEETGRKERIRFINAALEVANNLSIPVLNFSSGVLRRNLIHDSVPVEEATQMLIEGVRACLKNAGEVTMALEPESTMHIHDKTTGQVVPIVEDTRFFPLLRLTNVFLETTSQAIQIIREINSPQLGLNMDITHVKCFESDLLRSTAEALPYTRHIHIADVKGRVHHHEIPGEGDIDFRSLFRVLKNGNYEHYLSVELYWHSDEWERALYQSRKHLLEQMKTSEGNN